jgi:thymidylate synthase (FAD)
VNPLSITKVLNHGFVRLVDSMGSDLNVVRAARVSYDAAWRAGDNEKSDVRLINYLWKNKHTTPFESVTFTFEIKAPIFVLRQWHRHRTQSYNEVSARYTELPEEFYIPELEYITTQSTSNKQMRTTEQHPDAKIIQSLIESSCKASFVEYKGLLAAGCPRELARGVLPFNTYSHMFVTMNLLNLMKFLTLRCHEHAQYEIRVYAEAMLVFARAVVPVTMAAWSSEMVRGMEKEKLGSLMIGSENDFKDLNKKYEKDYGKWPKEEEKVND